MDKTGRAPGSPMEPELQEFHTGAAVHAYRTFGCHALPGAAGVLIDVIPIFSP